MSFSIGNEHIKNQLVSNQFENAMDITSFLTDGIINEYKRTIKYLDDNFETTRSEFGKKVGDYIKEIQSKYSKVFLKPVKESFILKWSEFNK